MKPNFSRNVLVTVGLFAGLLIGGGAFATHLAQVTDLQTGETSSIASSDLEIGELNFNPHCHAACDSVFGHADPGGSLGHGEGFFLVNSPTPFHDTGDFTSDTLLGLSIDAPNDTFQFDIFNTALGETLTVPILFDPINDTFQFDIFNTALGEALEQSDAEPAELVSARNRLKENLAARREADQRFSDQFGQWLEDEGWEGGKVNDLFWLNDPPHQTLYRQRRQLIRRFGYSPEGQAVKAAKDDASVGVREAMAYLYSEVLPQLRAAAAKPVEGYGELEKFAKALGEAFGQSDAEAVDSDIVSVLDELFGAGALDQN